VSGVSSHENQKSSINHILADWYSEAPINAPLAYTVYWLQDNNQLDNDMAPNDLKVHMGNKEREYETKIRKIKYSYEI
jgi:hypothetical protein